MIFVFVFFLFFPPLCFMYICQVQTHQKIEIEETAKAIRPRQGVWKQMSKCYSCYRNLKKLFTAITPCKKWESLLVAPWLHASLARCEAISRRCKDKKMVTWRSCKICHTIVRKPYIVIQHLRHSTKSDLLLPTDQKCRISLLWFVDCM